MRLIKCFETYKWWFQIFVNFHPYLGKWSNWTNIFQMGWNHQLGQGLSLFVLWCPVVFMVQHFGRTFAISCFHEHLPSLELWRVGKVIKHLGILQKILETKGTLRAQNFEVIVCRCLQLLYYFFPNHTEFLLVLDIFEGKQPVTACRSLKVVGFHESSTCVFFFGGEATLESDSRWKGGTTWDFPRWAIRRKALELHNGFPVRKTSPEIYGWW